MNELPGVLEQARRNWWLFLVRGIVALIFGVAAIMYPGAIVRAFVLVFGIYAFVDGVIALAYAFTPATMNRWALVLAGLAGIGIGYVTLRSPQITAVALYAYIAFWAIFEGVALVAYAIQLRKVIAHEGMLIAAGIAQLALGVLLLVLPRAGVLTLVWLIALFAFVVGILSIGLALRLHRLGGVERPTPVVR
jgi:uncharacterized membrane protein HdeD (DUF308 family)